MYYIDSSGGEHQVSASDINAGNYPDIGNKQGSKTKSSALSKNKLNVMLDRSIKIRENYSKPDGDDSEDKTEKTILAVSIIELIILIVLIVVAVVLIIYAFKPRSGPGHKTKMIL